MVAQEFGCTLSQAMHELRHLPHGLLWEVLDLRHYARAYHDVMRAKKQEEIQPSPWVDLVMDVRAEIFKRDRGL